jgi:hypothetical protein
LVFKFLEQTKIGTLKNSKYLFCFFKYMKSKQKEIVERENCKGKENLPWVVGVLPQARSCRRHSVHAKVPQYFFHSPGILFSSLLNAS